MRQKPGTKQGHGEKVVKDLTQDHRPVVGMLK